MIKTKKFNEQGLIKKDCENLIKLSFFGDITCDKPLLEYSKKNNGKFDFSPVFSKITSLICNSDYNIANFETVCAGFSSDSKREFFLLNTPDEIVFAIKDCGIDFLTTANNHCLDYGFDGLFRTLSLLDENNISHSGTYRTYEESSVLNNIIEIEGIKIAILAYTYSTNESNTGIVLDESNDYHVGLLREQIDLAKESKGIKGILARNISPKTRRRIQRIRNRAKLGLGISYFKPYTDRITKYDNENSKYLIKMKEDILKAKRNADIVVVCPHMGGQFNEKPGEYSEFIVNYIDKCGADLIVANHPHVVQKVLNHDGKVIAYSLGSFNLSLSADYIVHESLPQYSIVLHVYINTSKTKIIKVTFSILKIIEDDNKGIIVYPLDKLPEKFISEDVLKEITAIYNRVTGNSCTKIDILEEYDLA
ncbi:MAG: CapA family protein [Peptoniphilaceae bacterium]|nr:CapA family protein [Peptoniphilaceae bacterium]MDY3737906.1 CapA family protein [Peptoniphilaceae bacterium]